MQYIVHKRFKGKALCGYVNLPALTICRESEGLICYEDQPLCAAVSENAHQHFARDDDGQGMLRGRLTQTIQKKLRGNMGQPDYQPRWDKVWGDKLCQKYKRVEFDDHWLWNHHFFNAPVEDLKKILSLICEK